VKMHRSSGLLLHPTSLPGPGGIGCLGDQARQFIDILARAGQKLWQILPLNPTGYDHSPYQSLSAFAGNPLLIDPFQMIKDGLLDSREMVQIPELPGDRVNYKAASEVKKSALKTAFEFAITRDNLQTEWFRKFCLDNRIWLEDYALFRSLKYVLGGIAWYDWPAPFRDRKPQDLKAFSADHEKLILFEKFKQAVFFMQWKQIKSYALNRGIEIIGDMPIFVSLDSADVWANRKLFHLDSSGLPTVVSGVPPDYFSSTGQKWGNPLYHWEQMAGDDYAWWIARFKTLFKSIDIIRLDHFRGFEKYWEIPGSAITAETGRWCDGPGFRFFESLFRSVDSMSIIAEDLGVITPEVEALRIQCGFPGMKILQFAFDSGSENPYLPHNYSEMCVAYTGTHDNDTTRGWYQALSTNERDNRAITDYIRDYMGFTPKDVPWDFIALVMQSNAAWTIFPVQDVLALDSGARMNTPGQTGGNWLWRLHSFSNLESQVSRLRDLTAGSGRY
jgi:4-alpha-glucanotransferase